MAVTLQCMFWCSCCNSHSVMSFVTRTVDRFAKEAE